MLPVCKLPQNSMVFYIILVLFYFVNVASLQVATWQQWKRTSVCPRLLFRSVSPWWTRDLKKHDRNIKEVNTLFHIYGTLAKYIINLIQQMAKKQIKSNSFHKPYPTNSIAFRTRRPTAPRACLVTKDKWLFARWKTYLFSEQCSPSTKQWWYYMVNGDIWWFLKTSNLFPIHQWQLSLSHSVSS